MFYVKWWDAKNEFHKVGHRVFDTRAEAETFAGDVKMLGFEHECGPQDGTKIGGSLKQEMDAIAQTKTFKGLAAAVDAFVVLAGIAAMVTGVPELARMLPACLLP